MKNMKAATYRAYGGADVLEIVDVPKPEPASNEVLVEIHASSINPIDWKMRDGMLRLIRPMTFPVIPGFDLSGRVVEVGGGVDTFKVGDEIYSRSNKKSGEASAEYIALETDVITLKPDAFSFAEAAAVPLAALTALQAMRDDGGLKAGQRVMVNGASGGVGTYAVQIAKAMGASVTAVCSAANISMVTKLGADRVIDYTAQNPLEGEGHYDLIFDAVATLSLGAAKSRLTATGTFVTTVPGASVIFAILIGNTFSAKKARFIRMKPSASDLAYLTGLANNGQLVSIIDSTFPLIDLQNAHLRSEEGRAKGKIVVEMK